MNSARWGSSAEHATSRMAQAAHSRSSATPARTPPAECRSTSPASAHLQQTPGARPALEICRKSRHGETRPPAPIIHGPPCWARSPSPRQRLGTTAGAPDGGRCRQAAAPACHPVGDRGGCGGAAGGWRRMSAGPGPSLTHGAAPAQRGGARARGAAWRGELSRCGDVTARPGRGARCYREAPSGAGGEWRGGSARGPGMERALSGLCLPQARPSCPAGHRATASRQYPGPASRGGAKRTQQPSRTRGAGRDSLISICITILNNLHIRSSAPGSLAYDVLVFRFISLPRVRCAPAERPRSRFPPVLPGAAASGRG